jgi:hypothetical protein
LDQKVASSACLRIEFASNSTELLNEDLLSVLGPLRLDEAENLASLLEAQIGPVANIHSEDVLLAETGLGRRNEV